MTHVKKYIDSLQDTVDTHDANVRLQLLEKVWEEYSAVQDQLEYNDDGEMQEHEIDREAITETYCEMRAAIDRIISEDRRARAVQQNHRSLEQRMKMAFV